MSVRALSETELDRWGMDKTLYRISAHGLHYTSVRKAKQDGAERFEMSTCEGGCGHAGPVHLHAIQASKLRTSPQARMLS